jgi:CPA1 family monovalent cation:H+ antiporter
MRAGDSSSWASGVAIGLAIGKIVARIHQRLDDPPVQVTISLLTPFAAYVLADRLGVSGILAVVTAGVYLGWRSPEITTARMRLLVRPVWETIGFVLNGFIFILIGLQLPDVLEAVSAHSPSQLAGYALLISIAVILVRVLWVFPAAYLPRWLFKSIRERDPYPGWQPLMLIGWTGMRGVVSLAAAWRCPLPCRWLGLPGPILDPVSHVCRHCRHAGGAGLEPARHRSLAADRRRWGG